MDNNRNLAVEGYQKAVEKLSGTDINAVIFLLLFIISLILMAIVLGNLSKKLRAKKQKEDFMRYTKEKNLTDEQIKIIWDYSKKLGRDPFLAIEFKAPFEKIIDVYIKENPNIDENLIKEMREKLGFDYVPYFVPITTSKDIELFQGGKLKTEEGITYNVALYDKDELYMYWVITDKTIPTIKPEDRVKVSFIRKSDAAYTLEGQVIDVINENGRVIVKIPHTFELIRIQRREYPRVEVEIESLLGKKEKKDGQEILLWIIAKILDISPSGAKVCINPEEKDKLKLLIGDKILLSFNLLEKEFQEEAEIVNIHEKQNILCYGVKFTDIKEFQQKHIFEFVRKEQKRLAELYKKQS
ncbi:flagellar brake protein [Sulfurihydrogenibium subterraneum]|uniref:flagellar brake protein n=1 Tax=Sulfurihydrogenibium subterraneum TaxID=171121 RepID=UPI0004915845|nr:PilZ domain-containing protein [Sulfurihydrogenibium subterraneum]